MLHIGSLDTYAAINTTILESSHRSSCVTHRALEDEEWGKRAVRPSVEARRSRTHGGMACSLLHARSNDSVAWDFIRALCFVRTSFRPMEKRMFGWIPMIPTYRDQRRAALPRFNSNAVAAIAQLNLQLLIMSTPSRASTDARVECLQLQSVT